MFIRLQYFPEISKSPHALDGHYVVVNSGGKERTFLLCVQ